MNAGRKVKIHAEGLVGHVATTADFPRQQFRRPLRQPRDDAQPARIRHGRSQLGEADIVHPALNDRMPDAKKFRDASSQGSTSSRELGVRRGCENHCENNMGWQSVEVANCRERLRWNCREHWPSSRQMAPDAKAKPRLDLRFLRCLLLSFVFGCGGSCAKPSAVKVFFLALASSAKRFAPDLSPPLARTTSRSRPASGFLGTRMICTRYSDYSSLFACAECDGD